MSPSWHSWQPLWAPRYLGAFQFWGKKEENKGTTKEEVCPMKKTREEMRQALRRKVESLIEEALDWYEVNDAPNLSQIETQMLAIRQKLGQEMTRLLIEGQEAVRPSETPLCPECQRPMRYKGEKEKTVDCLIGQVAMERAYYHCPHCQEGLFPPGWAT
jgi:hypothetical protein